MEWKSLNTSPAPAELRGAEDVPSGPWGETIAFVNLEQHEQHEQHRSTDQHQKMVGQT